MTSKQQIQKQKIEFETVNIKVPKPVLEFLRFEAKAYKCSLEEEIEFDLLDKVRADMEALSGEELIKLLDFGSIFWEVLGDKNYKPEELETEQPESGQQN